MTIIRPGLVLPTWALRRSVRVMAARKRSLLSQIRRDLYLAQRGIGTAQAASRGPVPLGKRLARRRVTRSFFGSLRRKRLW